MTEVADEDAAVDPAPDLVQGGEGATLEGQGHIQVHTQGHPQGRGQTQEDVITGGTDRVHLQVQGIEIKVGSGEEGHDLEAKRKGRRYRRYFLQKCR